MAEGRKRLNLALQGGGAHGAFTRGVLDRLLEDGRLEIVAICGTSAGAMNGAALAYGLARGGPAGPSRAFADALGASRRSIPVSAGKEKRDQDGPASKATGRRSVG